MSRLATSGAVVVVGSLWSSRALACGGACANPFDALPLLGIAVVVVLLLGRVGVFVRHRWLTRPEKAREAKSS